MTPLQPGTVAWLDPIHSAPTLLLVAVVAHRVSALREGGAARSLWFALVGLLGGSVVNVAPVNQWLLQAAGPSGQAVAVEVFTVMASAFVLLLVAQTTAAATQRRVTLISLLALALMAGPLLLVRPGDAGDLAARPGGIDPLEAATWAVHWTAVLGLLAWALVAAVALCRRYSRAAPAGPLRTRLHLIGVGCASGLGFVAARVMVIAVDVAGTGQTWEQHGLDLQNAFLAVSLLLIATGAGYPQLVSGLATASTEASSARSLLRLRRLWRVMVRAAPGITLAPTPLTALVAGPLSLRERLYRRVMEIRDGLLALGPYASGGLRQEVAASALARGSSTQEAAAVAEAVWITAAVRAKDSGREPPASAEPRAVKGGADLHAEVVWLELVADAHARWPLTRALEAEHLGRAA